MNRKKYKYDFDCTINQSTQPQQVSIILREDELENKVLDIKELVSSRLKEVLIQTKWLKKWDKISYQATWVSELKNPREVMKNIIEARNNEYTNGYYNNKQSTTKKVLSLLH